MCLKCCEILSFFNWWLKAKKIWFFSSFFISQVEWQLRSFSIYLSQVELTIQITSIISSFRKRLRPMHLSAGLRGVAQHCAGMCGEEATMWTQRVWSGSSVRSEPSSLLFLSRGNSGQCFQTLWRWVTEYWRPPVRAFKLTSQHVVSYYCRALNRSSWI